ncbi:MAG: hypothetical protein ABW179_03010 [Methylobacterium sp.]
MKSKLIKAALVSLLPSGSLRKMLYRRVFGFQIHGRASIGWLSVFAVKSLSIGENSRIGSFNVFKGPIDVTIGARTRIGRKNVFTANWKLDSPRYAAMKYTPELAIGDGCLVLNDHYFDVYGRFELGDGSWIAGVGSQFWTHGVSVLDRDIIIGRGNYIGSAVRFAPGASIGNDNLVAIGSVVLSKVDGDMSLISGFPAKAIKSIAEAKAEGRYRFSFDDWAD